MIPSSGAPNWIEFLVFIGSIMALTIYVYRVFLPMIKEKVAPDQSPEERAKELMKKYRQENKVQQGEEDANFP